MYTQRRIKQFIGIVLCTCASLILIGCAAPEASPTIVPTSTHESVPPTQTLPPTNTPPPMTAQPAPEIPVVTEVVTITVEADSLNGDIPGIFSRPLESPSEWVVVDDLMLGFAMFAWRCENSNLTPFSKPTDEVMALAAEANDDAGFQETVGDLEAEGYIVRISKPLVFNDDFGTLPIAQTIECEVQQALDLFGEAPESLPGEIGMASLQRTGIVDGEEARERMWLVVWKDE